MEPAANLGDLGDEQLMALVSTGDAAALEVLYDRYAAVVLGFLLKIVREREAAEDLLQETFWRVWQRAGQFQAVKGKFASWMFTIARNTAIDHCRRQAARPQTLAGEGESDPAQLAADPEADVPGQALAAIKHAQVRAALEALPLAQRQVIELAYFGGLTRQEIAARIGEPLGTVHTRARLGLRKLRQTLLERGYES